MRGTIPKALSLPVVFCLVVSLFVVSGAPTPAGAATAAPVPSLSVTPLSGPVGSVVVIRAPGCGPQILFGPARHEMVR
jgi:hypothetical protein